MNPLNVGLGVTAALIYGLLGYSAQDKPFNWKKFMRTAAIGAFSALGLDVAGITLNVYTALAGPTAIKEKKAEEKKILEEAKHVRDK